MDRASIGSCIAAAALAVAIAAVLSSMNSEGLSTVAVAATATPTPGPAPSVSPTPLPSPQPLGSPVPGVQTFFPTRPAGVQLLKATGIFQGLSYGMKSGGFAIVSSSGTTFSFYSPLTIQINGVATSCLLSPNGQSGGYQCSGWPPSLVQGKTSITATYWNTLTPSGGMAFASDEIDY